MRAVVTNAIVNVKNFSSIAFIYICIENTFVFSVGQMVVSPSFHYYFLHLLIMPLQVSLKMEHLLIVCLHINF